MACPSRHFRRQSRLQEEIQANVVIAHSAKLVNSLPPADLQYCQYQPFLNLFIFQLVKILIGTYLAALRKLKIQAVPCTS
jgi:hypothetical protein